MGNPNSQHACHDPQHSASPVCPGRRSTDSVCPASNMGKEMHTFPIASSEQGVRNECSQRWQKVILIVLWWLSQPWFPHLIQLCVNQPCTVSALTYPFSLPARIPSAYMQALMQHLQAEGFAEEVSRLTADLEDYP